MLPSNKQFGFELIRRLGKRDERKLCQTVFKFMSNNLLPRTVQVHVELGKGKINDGRCSKAGTTSYGDVNHTGSLFVGSFDARGIGATGRGKLRISHIHSGKNLEIKISKLLC